MNRVRLAMRVSTRVLARMSTSCNGNILWCWLSRLRSTWKSYFEFTFSLAGHTHAEFSGCILTPSHGPGAFVACMTVTLAILHQAVFHSAADFVPGVASYASDSDRHALLSSLARMVKGITTTLQSLHMQDTFNSRNAWCRM